MIRSFLKGGIFYKTPQLHENTSISKDSDIVNKWYVDTKVNNTQINTKQYIDSRVASIPIVDAGSFVNIRGNQNINGRKYFNSSPTVPNPTSGTHAANKAYVDSKTSSGSYTQSLGHIGWTKFPNGLIIQWGRRNNISSGSQETITFPINFTQVLNASVTRLTTFNTNTMYGFHIKGLTNNSITIINGTQSMDNCYWFAIGY